MTVVKEWRRVWRLSDIAEISVREEERHKTMPAR